MEASENPSMDLEIRKRSKRFTSLRAAQRILANSAHPSELEATFEQGRAVVLELQSLDQDAGDEPRARECLGRIDRSLDEISSRTREILARTPISELRAHLPRLAEEHPGEIEGFIETILEGGTGSDKQLRILEYVVTLRCSEERGSRRVVVRSPGAVAPQLASLAEAGDGNFDPVSVEAIFADATRTLFREEDVGAIRDRIRTYKEELGSRILEPRVLEAAVAYNVAMWNRMAGLLEGSRLLDRLADDVLAADRSARAREPLAPGESVFDSRAFETLVSSLRARVKGDAPEADAAGRVVSMFDLGTLSPAEIEALESDDEDLPTLFTRAAIALNQAVRQLPDGEGALRELGVDPERLEGPWLDELMREITTAAQKLLADGRFAEACRLSEIRAKNLGVLCGARLPAAEMTPRRRVPPAATSRLDLSFLGKHAAAAFLVLWFVLLAFLLWPASGVDSLSKQELSQISPHLESGHQSDEGGTSLFVGVLNTGWDRLSTQQRRADALRIGERFDELGVKGVVLLDRFQRLQVSYSGGSLVELTPNPALPAP
ncbi:MAG: hypothetical protein JRS35_07115 [Deltaproteobacteria bacterium]|nr:hypothetical protein [Deltaproteobacteria bacterium]